MQRIILYFSRSGIISSFIFQGNGCSIALGAAAEFILRISCGNLVVCVDSNVIACSICSIRIYCGNNVIFIDFDIGTCRILGIYCGNNVIFIDFDISTCRILGIYGRNDIVCIDGNIRPCGVSCFLQLGYVYSICIFCTCGDSCNLTGEGFTITYGNSRIGCFPDSRGFRRLTIFSQVIANLAGCSRSYRIFADSDTAFGSCIGFFADNNCLGNGCC